MEYLRVYAIFRITTQEYFAMSNLETHIFV